MRLLDHKLVVPVLVIAAFGAAPASAWGSAGPSTTPVQRAGTVSDGRSPDTRDAALAAHGGRTIVLLGDSTFEWGDAGIGAAGGFGIALLLGGVAGLAQRGRGKLAV